MPSAPKARAIFASCGVSALARTRSVRTSSAQPISRSKAANAGAFDTGSVPRMTCTTSLGVVGRSPAKIFPVAPSSVSQSPSLIVTPFIVQARRS